MQHFGHCLADFFVLQMNKLKLIEHAATCLISEKCSKDWWLLIPAMVFSSLSLCFWLWAPLAAVCWPYLCEICVQDWACSAGVTMMWWQAKLFLARNYTRTWRSCPQKSKDTLHNVWQRESRFPFRIFYGTNDVVFSKRSPTPPWTISNSLSSRLMRITLHTSGTFCPGVVHCPMWKWAHLSLES